ncbi:MAG: hypothetical protein R3C18_14550 [Planctomycetaceae bacterium]
MSKENLVESKPMVAIRKLALKYPEVEEGASCANRAFKARKKAFAFMGMNEATHTNSNLK